MTDDQLISKLRKVVREEVEAETKKTEQDTLFSNVRVIKLVKELKDIVKDIKISNSRVEKGLDVVKTEQTAQGQMLKTQGKTILNIQVVQQTQSKTLDEHGKILNEHGKALKSIKTKLDKTYAVVNYMAGDFDERIAKNSKRIEKIEDHLGVVKQ